MCQRIGRPPISTIGFGRTSVSSERRVPRPPARTTTFMRGFWPIRARASPQLALQDLARRALRQRGDDLDHARVLVGGEPLLAEADQLFAAGGGPLLERHHRLHLLAVAL